MKRIRFKNILALLLCLCLLPGMAPAAFAAAPDASAQPGDWVVECEWVGSQDTGYTKAIFHFRNGDETADREVTPSHTVTTQASCTEHGVTEYTATLKKNDAPDRKKHEAKTTANVPAAMGHSFQSSKVSYSWTKAGDSYTCTASGQCKSCKKTVTVDGVVTFTDNPAATCTASGSRTYTAAFSGSGLQTQTRGPETVAALGHDWGGISYTWAEDHSTVTAERICQREGCGAKETETVSASGAQSKEPTCTEPGKTTYTSAAFENSAFKIQTETVANIPATGHKWGTAGYEWIKTADGWNVKASRVCQNDATHTEEETVAASSQALQAPTCTAPGEVLWTSEAFENPAFEVQNKGPEAVNALGHDWGEISYTWSEDHSTVTAERVCGHDSTHRQTETAALASSEQTKDPTCTEPGETTYTSEAFDNTAFEVQTDVVADVEPLGHVWGEPSYDWDLAHLTLNASRVCQREGCEETEEESVALGVETVNAAVSGANVLITMRYTPAAFENTAFSAEPQDSDYTLPISFPGARVHSVDFDKKPNAGGAQVLTEEDLLQGCCECAVTLSEDGQSLQLSAKITDFAPFVKEGYRIVWSETKRGQDDFIFYFDSALVLSADGVFWSDWTLNADMTAFRDDTYVAETKKGMELVTREDHTGETVTYEFDIGKATGTTPDPITYTFGSTTGVSLPETDGFSYDRHDFLGWATKKNNPDYLLAAGEALTDDNAPYDKKSPITLYAVWQLHTYRLSVDLDGGESTLDYINNGIEIKGNQQNKRYHLSAFDGTNVTMPGTDAVAWGLLDTDTDESYRMNQDRTLPAGDEPLRDMNLRVLWQVKLRYVLDGETVGEETMVFKGDTVTVNDAPEIPAGSHFCGWVLNDEEGTIYQPGDSLTAGVMDLVFTAQYSELTAHEAHAATCTEDGNSAYWSCEQCGKFYSDANGENEIEEGDWVLLPLGHDWGAVGYAWTEDGEGWKVTASRVCQRSGCGAEEKEEVAATSEITTEPTCTEVGEELWTAVFENEAFQMQTKPLEIAALGHTWGEVSYVWAEDGDGWSVTATRVCANDAEHKETETVGATSQQTLAPTCTEPGELTWTSDAFENPAFEVQTNIKELEALGHEWGEWTVTTAPTCTEKGVETRTCAHDASHTETREVDALGHTPGEPVRENEKPATCTEAGSYEEVVYCTVCKEELSREEKTEAALGHAYALNGWTWNGLNAAAANFVCGHDAQHTLTVNAAINVTRTEPGCETAGTISYTATAIFEGATYTDGRAQNLAALGHQWGPWVVTKEPTETEEGEETRTCLRDGDHTETRPIPKLQPAPVEEEPQVEEPQTPEVILEESVPLAAPEQKVAKPLTIVNLILGAASLLTGLGMAVSSFTKKKRSKLLGLIPAVAAVAVIALTETLNGPVQAFDKWTVAVAALAAANGVLAYLTRAGKGKPKA